MSRVRIEKLLLFAIAPMLLLAVFGFQLLDSSPPNHDAGIMDEAGFDEIDRTYLNLFREFKQLKIESWNHKSKSRVGKVLRRDPFVRPDVDLNNIDPSTPKFFTENNLKLTGVLWDEQSPSAVINGEIVQVGSQLGSFRVARIQPEKVILTSAESRVVLELSDERVPQKRFREQDD